jgi:poly(3-hydroxybutyrate) depolymerase
MTNQLVPQGTDRVYHISVPADPAQEVAPTIVVFHGGGQDATTIARRWGIEPGSPVPANVADYLLVFPEADARLADEWVHFKKSDSAFPTLDAVGDAGPS